MPRVLEKEREGHLRRKFGMTPAEYTRLEEAQGYRCAICERPRGQTKLAVDHDHKTGAIRGLLCNNCNRALGHFQDDPELLTRAADYLRGGGPHR